MNLRSMLPLTAVCVLAVSTCRAAEVHSDYDHNVNFANYHTYSWGQVKTANPFYVDRVKSEVNRDLQKKGWQLVPSGGSTTVFATGEVHNQQEVETYYNDLGGGWGGGWGWGGWGWGGWGPGGFGSTTTQTVQRPVGHLVVDIFDSSSHQLLFRGIASDAIKSNSTKNTHELFKDIDKMFQHFPPKPTQ